jgi:hypothetical protein
VEGVFCELRRHGVLRSSAIAEVRKAGARNFWLRPRIQ